MGLTIPLPRYRWHKTLQALKIEQIINTAPNISELHFTDQRFVPVAVPAEWVDRHHPRPGGYFVIYESGYQSFIPAEQFENGWVPMEGNEA